jgi:hypothetical protein
MCIFGSGNIGLGDHFDSMGCCSTRYDEEIFPMTDFHRNVVKLSIYEHGSFHKRRSNLQAGVLNMPDRIVVG